MTQKLISLPFTETTTREAEAFSSIPASTRSTPRRGRKTGFLIVRTVIILAGIGLAVVVPMGWGQWLSGRSDQTTDDAYLHADTTALGTQVSGKVKGVLVRDFQQVNAGDVLVNIDDASYRAHVALAMATVDAALAKEASAQSEISLQAKVIAQAKAALGGVQADRDRSALEYARQVGAARDGWSTSQKLENAVADMKRVDAQLAEKQADLEAQQQRVELLGTQLAQARAEVESAKADLEIAEIDLDHTNVRSPINGVVNASSVRVGQYLAVGSRVISVVPLPHVYVLANYKETQLRRMRVGQPAEVSVDTFPGHVLKGRVSDISPASGSEFALLPADNATGNFTKVAQRIAVKIEIADADGLQELLRPGMSVVPTVFVDNAGTTSAKAATPQ
jgi:membrane fusion protein (multidrug efflux system)